MEVFSLEWQQKLFSQVKICPPEHAELFCRHPQNRPLVKDHVVKLVNIFKEGKKIIHPILVVVEGGLYYVIDGQHRLEATRTLGIGFLYVDVTSVVTLLQGDEVGANNKEKWDKAIRRFVGNFNIGVKAATKAQAVVSRSKCPLIEHYDKLADNIEISRYNGQKKAVVVGTIAELKYPSLAFVEVALNMKKYAKVGYTLMDPLTDKEKSKMEFLLHLTVAVQDGMGGYAAVDNSRFREVLGLYTRQHFEELETFPFDKLTKFIKGRAVGITHENRAGYYYTFDEDVWLKDFEY